MSMMRSPIQRRPATADLLPMTAAEVILAIESRGGRIWVDDGRVRFHMPPGRAVSIEVIRALKRHEADLVTRLTTPNQTGAR